jgi:hypothetical protein
MTAAGCVKSAAPPALVVPRDFVGRGRGESPGDDPQSAGGWTETLPPDATLVFADWNIARLERQPPAGVQQVAQRLARFAELLGLEAPQLQVWCPTDDDIQAIADAVEIGDWRLLARVVHESLADCVSALTDHLAAQRRPLNYAEARRQLIAAVGRARHSSFYRPRLDQALEQLDEVFHRQFIQPLLEEAAANRQAARRALLLALVGLLEQWHAADRFVHAARHGAAGLDDPQGEHAMKHERQRREPINRQLAALVRVLQV